MIKPFEDHTGCLFDLFELSCEGFLTYRVFNSTHSLHIHSLLLLSVQPTPILKKCAIVWLTSVSKKVSKEIKENPPEHRGNKRLAWNPEWVHCLLSNSSEGENDFSSVKSLQGLFKKITFQLISDPRERLKMHCYPPDPVARRWPWLKLK